MLSRERSISGEAAITTMSSFASLRMTYGREAIVREAHRLAKLGPDGQVIGCFAGRLAGDDIAGAEQGSHRG